MKFKSGDIFVSKRGITSGRWLVLQVKKGSYSYLHLKGYCDIEDKEYSKINHWTVIDTSDDIYSLSDGNYTLIK